MQGPGTVHSLGTATHHVDTCSDSLNQLSYGSPAWAMGATERSFYGSGEGGHVVERGPESTNDNPDSIIAPPQQQQQQVESGGGQAKNWGLWHEGDGEGSADEGAGEATGSELRPDHRCVHRNCNTHLQTHMRALLRVIDRRFGHLSLFPAYRIPTLVSRKTWSFIIVL